MRRPVPLLLVWLLLRVCVCLAQSDAVSATETPLELPSGIAYSPTGELFLAETRTHRVRKVDTQGRISTVAGTGEEGFSGDGGPAIAAELDSPQTVAVDSHGNVFVADAHNHRVRRLDGRTGIISTVAGGGTGKLTDPHASATSVALILPVAVAMDAAGDLFVVDAGAHEVLRVDSTTGGVLIVAGNGQQGDSGDGGPAVDALIDAPSSLAIDSAGNLYLADPHNHRVRRVDAVTGRISTVPGTAGAFALPRGIVLSAAGELFVSDSGAQRVLRVLLHGSSVAAFAGSGAQAFAGDLGAATAAALDSPAALAISPDGLVTIADSHNGRIRQVDGDARIHTIAGLADRQPVGLALIPDPSLTYGAGSVRATIVTSGTATGTAILQETLAAGPVTLQTVPVSGSGISFSTATLAAGTHTVQLLYSGDALHAAAASQPALLTISPANLTVVPVSAAMSYGESPPKLAGTVTGVLPQDAQLVSVQIGSAVSQSSPVGVYPVVVAATGSAAGNYRVSAASASVTVRPARSVVAIRSAVSDGRSGLATQIAVTSSTSGQPGGTVTLLDGGTPVAAGAVPPGGSSSFDTGTLASGTHVLTAFYSGDGNFTPGTSDAVSITLGSTDGGGSGAPATGDFVLAVSGPATQTSAAGAAVSYAFAVTWTGAPLSGPVTLSASGAPALSTVSFNPGYLPPGGAVTAFSMTVQLPNATTALLPAPSGGGHAGLLLALLLPLSFLGRGSRAVWRRRLVLCAAPMLLFAAGCGDRVNVAGSDHSGVTETRYPITVTATSTTAAGTVLEHAQAVTLVVQRTN